MVPFMGITKRRTALLEGETRRTFYGVSPEVRTHVRLPTDQGIKREELCPSLQVPTLDGVVKEVVVVGVDFLFCHTNVHLRGGMRNSGGFAQPRN